MLSCPVHMPVAVRAYVRFRLGQWENVCAHCRGLPRRKAEQLRLL